jgi:hypothetical protein
MNQAAMIAGALTSVLLAGCLFGDSRETERSPALAGASVDLFGINVAADGAGSDVVGDLGAAWVRLELIDGSTGGALDPGVAAQLDATLADYESSGVRVLLIYDYASLGGNPGFGSGAPCTGWYAWRSAWLARLDHVAQQFGSRIGAWEIWNEPDHPAQPCASGDYTPGMPAAHYGPLLRDAYNTIRGAGASGPIVVGGLDSGQVSYVAQVAASTGGLYADAVAIHPYGVVPSASWCPDPGEDLDCDWGTLGGKVDEYRAASGLPVWITEFGLKTEDTAHQARYLVDAYTVFANRGVPHAFVFCESDAMVAPFGLTYADRTPKPDVFAAYQALAQGAAAGGEPGATHASRLHGTVEVGGTPLPGIVVTAWGHDAGDFHATTTDPLGIYAFEGLQPASLYNVVVNARFTAAGFATIDGAHASEVRDNVELVAGPDDWHGEDFSLPH